MKAMKDLHYASVVVEKQQETVLMRSTFYCRFKQHTQIFHFVFRIFYLALCLIGHDSMRRPI